MNASYVYELPFAKNMSGAAKHLLDGWTVTGIITLETGRPLNVFLPFDNANVGSRGTFQRPNLVGDPFSGLTQGFGPGQKYFNVDAFAVPQQFTFGNLGRNAVQGPSFRNVDFGLYKNIFFGERYRLQFRSEFFNFFNNTNFGNPQTGVGRPTFGEIAGTVTTQRQIQFGLKFSF